MPQRSLLRILHLVAVWSLVLALAPPPSPVAGAAEVGGSPTAAHARRVADPALRTPLLFTPARERAAPNASAPADEVAPPSAADDAMRPLAVLSQAPPPGVWQQLTAQGAAGGPVGRYAHAAA